MPAVSFTLIPAELVVEKVSPESADTSGMSDAEPLACHMRYSVVTALFAASEAPFAASTWNAFGMPRLPTLGTVGPVRPLVTQEKTPPAVRAVPTSSPAMYNRLL